MGLLGVWGGWGGASVGPMEHAGRRVRLRGSPTTIGILTGRSRERAGVERLQVEFPEGTQWVPADQLEDAATVREHPVDLLAGARLGGAVDLRRTLAHRRLSVKLADLIYSMEATNTDFYPYQFKPVLKLLSSPTSGLLVADEVGLGKTIEAGLVWTELRSRFDYRRLLVLCPAALTEKWRFELRDKFGVHARTENAAGLLRTLREEEHSNRGFALIGSVQGLRPPRGWDDEDDPVDSAAAQLARFLAERESLDPLVDLVIIDEAHHLRNPETMTHRLGVLVRGVSRFRLLLTATPVHNRSRDLLSVLSLLDPDTFQRSEDLEAILEANEPLVRGRDALLAGRIDSKGLRQIYEDAMSHRLLEGNRQLEVLSNELPDDDQLSSPSVRSQIAYRLEHVNLLAHAVTRTRKRNVMELRVVRDPVAQKVPMTPVERRLYDGVTQLVRDFARTRDINDMFLLATPQRQLASCMAAALGVWTRRQLALTAVDELEVDPRAAALVLGPLSTFLAERAPQLANLDDLERQDTKFDHLASRLKVHLGAHPDAKIVLFSSFRPTLGYLDRRLRACGLSTIQLVGQGPGTLGENSGRQAARPYNKDEAIERFRAPDGPSILLASEVGGEGIDLQFSRVIVNYDLPWNPMRVEQRIGRLDRIGQESDSILIWNMLHEDTIDERIYDRLYERLDLCRHALGDIEAVLGEQVRDLEHDLLTKSLSPAQQEERINQTAQALENQRREEEELEGEAQHLVAYGDYILNQVRAAHEMNRWIGADDVRRYVIDFFRRHYTGSEFRQLSPNEPDYEVKLSAPARRDLEDFVRHQNLEPTVFVDVRTGVTRCSFAHRASGRSDRRRGEVVTQFHPLVRFVSARTREVEEQLTPAVAVLLSNQDLPAGDYVGVISYWAVRGLTTTERLVYAARPLAGGPALEPDSAERLILAAGREGEDWVGARSEVDLAIGVEIAEQLFEDLARRFQRHVDEVEAENLDRADIQERNLDRHLQTQRSTLGEVRARHVAHARAALVRATEGRIAAVEERVERQRERIRARRTVDREEDELVAAIVRVVAS